MPIILTDQMVQEATDVAQELHEAFTGILKLPTVDGRRASALSNELHVGRMTCQRIVKLGKSGDTSPGPQLLTQLPGTQGLRQFLDALAQTGTSRKLLSNAVAAVEKFELFLRNISLSQSGFEAALLLHQQGSNPERQRARRADLFEATSAVTGQSANATISMMAIRPSLSEGHNIEQIAIRGYAGMQASGSAMPIRLPMNMAYADYRNVTGDEAQREPQQLIEEFCTRPLPNIDTRIIKAKHLAHIINPEHIPTGESFDCFARQHTRWNIKGMGGHMAIWLYIDYPTRYCSFDLHLHRSIEENNDVSADCHMWGTSLLAPPEDLWMTRFADQMTFTKLGEGLQNTASDAYAKHKELTEYMFASNGWDPSEFTGYRCEMELPIWRSGLCLILEES
ncbi:MAG: hypothetical protein P8L37_03980 [Phycisphaerales bacterium]|nr:hypothetical protein [Phycisphaerales bacterium]